MRKIMLLILLAFTARAFDIEPVPPDTAAGAPSLDAPSDAGGAAVVSSDTAVVPVVVSPDTAIASPDTVAAPVRRPRTREDLEGMSREEIFRLAFGRAAPERPRSLRMRLFVDDRYFEEIEVVHEEDFSSFNFISNRFKLYLDRILLPGARPEVGDSVGYFNSAILRSANYVVNSNEAVFELRVTVPPEKKSLQLYNLSGIFAGELRGEPVKPAHVSFYMNYRLTDRFSYRVYDRDPDYIRRGQSLNEDIYRRDPARLSLDGALTSLGFTLEGSAWLTEPREGIDGKRSWTWENFGRGDVRLVRDIVPLLARVSLGDVHLGNEILDGETVGGARYEYNKWFFGNDPHEGKNSVTFFMPRAGTVDLYMNGSFRQSFYLPAGHHQVTGFSGDVGRNQVRLVLRMADGGIDEVPFEYVQNDPRNLVKGDARYAIGAGARRDWAPSPECYAYDFENSAVSAYFLYGLSNIVSLGAAGQLSEYNMFTGAQLLLDMGGFGHMNFTGEMQYIGFEHTGLRASLRYGSSLAPTITKLNRSLTGRPDRHPVPNIAYAFGVSYQNSLYGSAGLFDTLHIEGDNMIGVSGDVGFGLLWGSISGTGGLIYTSSAAEPDNFSLYGYNYGMRLAQTIGRIAINMSAGVNVRDDVRTPYFSVSSSLGLGGGLRVKRHQFNLSTGIGMYSSYIQPVVRPIEYTEEELADPDFDGPEFEEIEDGRYRYDWRWNARAGWRWSNSSGAGGQSYSADLIWNDLPDELVPALRGSLRHTYNRAILQGNYSGTYVNERAYNLQTHNANATLAGSFMFADGLWALGRPVSGGFVLIDAGPALKEATLHVDRSSHRGRGFSHNGPLGAAYKNNVREYYASPFTISLTDAPVSAALSNNRFYALGGYKQGFALRLGSDANILMLVRFTSEGRPLSHVYATIGPAAEEGSAPAFRQATFTGADGVLQAGNLTPGKSYRVRFGSAAGLKDVIIDIPKNADYIFELPDMVVVKE